MRWIAGALRCAVTLAALGCNSGIEALENGGSHGPVELPPIALSKVLFEGYHGDLRDLSVTAASATVDLTARIANLRDVSIGLTGEDKSDVHIAAPSGEFHLDRDDFTLSEGVTGNTAEGERFATQTVHYISKRRVIVSDSAVELRRTNLVLSASGMELEVPTHRLRLTGNVKARVQPK